MAGETPFRFLDDETHVGGRRARIRDNSGKGYGHSMKSRITMLVIIAVFLSAMIVALVANGNLSKVTDEEYTQIASMTAEYAALLITRETAEGIEQKGTEAENYEALLEKLQQYVNQTFRLSGLCVVRVTEEGARVLFDVPPEGITAQQPGEVPGSEPPVAKLLPQTPAEVTAPVVDITDIGRGTVYYALYPFLREQAADVPAPGGSGVQPETQLLIIPYILSSEVPDYPVLFILQIIVQFSGAFILLLSFGFWISRFYLIYPVTAMSTRADRISGSLEDIVELDLNIAEMNDMSIHTADETETLYKAVCHLAQSVSDRMKSLQKLFDGTVFSLVNAIDAKDQYTHGHSSRVAVYSRRIAELSGKSEKECEEIYLSAILHDVGKIGIPGEIINKKGRLTDEEYQAIKQHPTIGYGILKDITEYPFLSVAAHYHHERYDGKGYPEGLKGEEIPEIARIIAVVDAYDAMTSNRSYRSAIPQHIVKEELIKGSGTQFDPQFARFMMMAKIQIEDHAKMGLSPKEVLERTNEAILCNNKDKMFVTVWFGILEISTGKIVAANAGHEYPLIRQPGKAFELFKDKHGFVLGAVPGKKYQEYEFTLEKGGTLFAYTDGVPEATRGDNELFGNERMLDAINEIPDGSPQELLTHVHGAVNRFVGGAPQFDDLTMLAIKLLP